MTFFNYSIYEIPEAKDSTEITITSDLVVVVMEDAFTNDERTLLKKILSTIGKNLDHAQLVVLKNDMSIKFTNQLKSDCLVILFGIQPITCGLQISNDLYQPITISYNSYVFSKSLKELPDKKEDRRSLWYGLKDYYNLD